MGLRVAPHRWVVHNIPTATGREQALGEMLRVLRPGGTLVLADIAHHTAYRSFLTAAGLTEMREDGGGAESRVAGVLSGGTFRPGAMSNFEQLACATRAGTGVGVIARPLMEAGAQTRVALCSPLVAELIASRQHLKRLQRRAEPTRPGKR